MLRALRPKYGRLMSQQMTLLCRRSPPSAVFLAGFVGDVRSFVSDEDEEKEQKSTNFDRDILKPAQDGTLTGKHSSAIPKLAARRNKAHLTPVVGRGGNRGPPPMDLDDLMGSGDDNDDYVPLGVDDSSEDYKESATDKTLKYIMEDYDPHFAFELMNDNKYYWREEEYEELVDGLDDDSILGLDDEEFEIEYTDDAFVRRPLLDESMAASIESLGKNPLEGMGEFENDQIDEGDDSGRPSEKEEKPRMDPEEWFFQGANSIVEAPDRDDLLDDDETFGPPPELYDVPVDLPPHYGPGKADFLQAMAEHPTKYARVSLTNQHPASQREPKPDFPRNRQPHPPIEYVEGYNRFLYVTGLPPLLVTGEKGDLENPVHRSFLEKLVARLVNVDSTQVWPVNTTSAFVGFHSPRAMADALAAGPSEKVLSLLPDVRLLSDAVGTKNPFEGAEVGQVLQLDNIPSGQSPTSFLRTFFPPNSQLETVFGKSLDPKKDVYFLSSTKVLVRFPSPTEAAAAATSPFLIEHLRDVGLYPIRFFRARRELVHAGFSGPVKDDEIRVMGPRLIVDGDMPSKDFFQSHPRCIHIRNLDPLDSSPEMLTDLFQPFSELPRKITSVERVTCEAGLPTDRAYIGFDIPGEAEACIRKCKGLIRIGDRRLLLRLVDDRIVPKTPLYRAEKRPARSADELWDDLHNWEKHVDPSDIEYLEDHGVSKVVIDEALRRIRRENPTFGPLDQAVRSEAIEPDTAPGDLYKEIVQLYIQTLKDCIATPTNVGPAYEMLHMPGEKIDLSIFEEWEKKKAEIEKARAKS